MTAPVLSGVSATAARSIAHLPIYGFEDLGFVPRGDVGRFIAERNTAPGARLPLNTNGGGLSYMHSGIYGMYALPERVHQMRGTLPAQIPGAKFRRPQPAAQEGADIGGAAAAAPGAGTAAAGIDDL